MDEGREGLEEEGVSVGVATTPESLICELTNDSQAELISRF